MFSSKYSELSRLGYVFILDNFDNVDFLVDLFNEWLEVSHSLQ